MVAARRRNANGPAVQGQRASPRKQSQGQPGGPPANTKGTEATETEANKHTPGDHDQAPRAGEDLSTLSPRGGSPANPDNDATGPRNQGAITSEKPSEGGGSTAAQTAGKATEGPNIAEEATRPTENPRADDQPGKDHDVRIGVDRSGRSDAGEPHDQMTKESTNGDTSVRSQPAQPAPSGRISDPETAKGAETHGEQTSISRESLKENEGNKENPAAPEVDKNMSVAEARSLLEIYTIQKTNLEQTLRSHTTGGATFLKGFSETYLKRLNVFLTRCQERINEGDKADEPNKSVIDLTLDDDDIQVIVPTIKQTTQENNKESKKRKREGPPRKKTDKTPSANILSAIKIKKKKTESSAPTAGGTTAATPNDTGDGTQSTVVEARGARLGQKELYDLTHRRKAGPLPMTQPDATHDLPPPQLFTLSEAERKRDEYRSDVTKPIWNGSLLNDYGDETFIMRHGDMRDTVNQLKAPSTEVTPFIYPKMQDIVSARVANYLRSGGGFQIPFFRMTETTPEFLNIINLASGPTFSWVIRATPRLIQLPAGDPFFNRKVINFENVLKAFENRNLDKQEKPDSSWIGLAYQVIRDDGETGPIYHEFEGAVKTGLGRLTSLMAECVAQLHKGLRPSEGFSDQSNTVKYQAAVENASAFIYQKIVTLGASTGEKNKQQGGSGLAFLQKRMWETLQGFVILHHAEVRKHTIDSNKETPKNWSNKFKNEGVSAKKKDSELRDLWRAGPAGQQLDSKKWGKLRLNCLGSAAVFLAYGPGGWWTCFNDQNSFNQRGIWGTINLAEMRVNHMVATARARGASDVFRSEHPWQNLERLMYSCLADLGFHLETDDDTPAPSVNWENVLNHWQDRLAEKTIYQCALLDLIPEIARPGQSISIRGNPLPHVYLGPERMPEHFYGLWESSLVSVFRIGRRTIGGPPQPPPAPAGRVEHGDVDGDPVGDAAFNELIGSDDGLESAARELENSMQSMPAVASGGQTSPPTGKEAGSRRTAPASSEDSSEESDSDSDSDSDEDEQDPEVAAAFAKDRLMADADDGADDTDGGEEERERRARGNPYVLDSVTVSKR